VRIRPDSIDPRVIVVGRRRPPWLNAAVTPRTQPYGKK